MKKTYVWVCVADPKAQYVCEVYGPWTEHMMSEINSGLADRPLTGFADNTAEVLCEVSFISPEVPLVENYNNVIYKPGYLECVPVRPLKVKTIEKVLIPR
jgi:hypothetical protein